LLILTLIDYKSVKEFWSIEKTNLIVIGLPILFLLSVLSLLYTTNSEKGMLLVFRYLPLLLFPFILFKVAYFSDKHINYVLKFFIYGCLLSVCYSYLYVLYEAFEGSYKLVHKPEDYLRFFLNRLTYHDLVSKIMVNHSIYFSAYILLAITVLRSKSDLFSKRISNLVTTLFFITLTLLTPVIIALAGFIIFTLIFVLQNNQNKTLANRYHLFKINIFWSFLLFYLFIWKIQPHKEFIYIFNNLLYNLIILGGALGTVLFGQIAYSLLNYKRIKWVIISMFILLGIFIVLLSVLPISLDVSKVSNYTARLVNNYASITVIKNNFFFGVGIGDIQESLIEIYRNIRFRKLQYNEHNQYLRFWLGSGFLSALIFIIWILKIFLKSLITKNAIAISISFTLLIFCFTESVLARQIGLSFFMFFMFFTYYMSRTKKRKSELGYNRTL